MPLRRSAPPRFRLPAVAVAAILPQRLAWSVLLGGAFLVAASPAFPAGAPLPPQKPDSLRPAASRPADAQRKAAPGMPLPAAGRPVALRSAPLPPRRPAELAEQDEEEAGAASSEQQDAHAQDGANPDANPDASWPERRNPAPRLAARSMPLPQEEGRPAGVPLPPPRPDGSAPDAGAPAQGQGTQGQGTQGQGTQGQGTPSEMPAACAAMVAEGLMVASLDPGISAAGACGLAQPVRLTAVRLDDGRLVPLQPAAVARCEMAVAATRWFREALAPAIAGQGGQLNVIRIAASYDCRPRNRIAGAKMSEHGRGNAVDVGGFELADGRIWLVEKGGLPKPMRAAMKESACSRFATVLGPGSDGYHEDHIHVDLAQRARDYKLCSWNLEAGAAVASRPDKPKASSSDAPTGPSADDKAGKEEPEAETGATEGAPAPMPVDRGKRREAR